MLNFFPPDAIAIVQKYGKPDLFVTMTASADWQEILDSLEEGESSHERPDIVSRVFEMKSTEFLDDICDGHVFGKILAIVGVVEWQKRGESQIIISITSIITIITM